MADVDAGVEQGDADAAPVHAGQADAQVARGTALSGHRGRIGGANRVDAGHARRAFDEGDRGSPSAAENPFTTRAYWNSGLTRTPLVARSEISCRCPAKMAAVQRRSCASLAWPPAAATRSASDGAFEQHDDPLPDRGRHRRRTDEAVPGARGHAGGLLRLRRRLLTNRRDQGSNEGGRDGDDQEKRDLRRRSVRPRTRTHRRKGSRVPPGPPGTAPPRRSSPRCPCRGRAARTRRRRVRSAARSSRPRRRRRRRAAPAPVCSTRSTSARTIARW